MQSEQFFITGGTLPLQASSYVERQADRVLVTSLLAGEYCYVLNSRQMGKSSLCVRTIQRLKEAGVRACFLDLTRIGAQNISPEQWYIGLLSEIGRALGLRADFLAFWKEHLEYSPVQRLFGALREMALEKIDGPLVIFIDELDAVKSLSFSTDEFFAAIRECYVSRVSESHLNRLTFCLIGTATPADLISDTRITPFNIGRRIALEDFTADEAAPLSEGLVNQASSASLKIGTGKSDSQLFLDRVLYWTGGHPYLTQSLCRRIAESSDVHSPIDVDRLCERTFLTAGARESDDNLAFVRRQILGSGLDLAGLLQLYGRILAGRKPVADDESNAQVSVLRLAGIVKSDGRRLRVRNRIYERVFDRDWIEATMPDAELRRQRAAFRRGVLRTAAIAVGVFAIIGFLGMKAVLTQRESASRLRTSIRLADENLRLEKDHRREASESLKRMSELMSEKSAASTKYKQAASDALIALAAKTKAEAAAQAETQRALKAEAIVRLGLAEARRAATGQIVREGDFMLTKRDPSRALLYYVEALKRDRGDRHAERIDRVRIARALDAAPTLIDVELVGDIGGLLGPGASKVIKSDIVKSGARYAAGYVNGGCMILEDGVHGLQGLGGEVRLPGGTSSGLWNLSESEPVRLVDLQTRQMRWEGPRGIAKDARISISRDGQWIAHFRGDKVTITNTQNSKRSLSRLPTHFDSVLCASFSPNGAYLSVASKSHIVLGTKAPFENAEFLNVTLISTGTGRITSLEPAAIKDMLVVRAPVFSMDSHRLAFASYDSVYVVNTQTGKPTKHDMRQHPGSSGVGQFLVDSRTLLLTKSNGSAMVIDAETGKVGRQFVWDQSLLGTAMKFGPDGDFLLSYDSLTSRSLRPYRYSASTQYCSLYSGETVKSAGVSSDGRLVLTYDGAIGRSWQPSRGISDWDNDDINGWGSNNNVRFDVMGPLYRMKFEGPGDWGEIGTDVSAWNLAILQPVHITHNERLNVVDVSARGERVLFVKAYTPVLPNAGSVPVSLTRIWDAKSGKWLGTGVKPGELGTYLDRDGEHIFTLDTGRAAVWSVQTGRSLGSWRWDSRYMQPDAKPGVAVHAIITRRNVVVEGNYYWTVFDLDHIGTIRSIPFALNRSIHVYSKNGALLAASQDGKVFAGHFRLDGSSVVQLYDADRGVPLGSPLPHADFITSGAFSPSGDLIVTATQRSVRIWSVRTGKPLFSPVLLGGDVLDLRFSHDGDLLAVRAGDGTRLFDTVNGDLVAGPFKLGAVEFSPDDRFLHILEPRAENKPGKISLDTSGMSLESLQNTALLLNGVRLSLDGSLKPVGSDEYMAAWRRSGPEYKRRFASNLITPNEWHAAQFDRLVLGDGFSGAMWHYYQLPVTERESAVRKAISKPRGALVLEDNQILNFAFRHVQRVEFPRVLRDLFPSVDGKVRGADCIAALHAGDMTEYRRLCNILLEQSIGLKKADQIVSVAKDCRYLPDGDPLYAILSDRLTEAKRVNPATAESAITPGFVHYRQGRYKEAYESIDAAFTAQKTKGNEWGLFLQAMAAHRLGQTQLARNKYNQAVSQSSHSAWDSIVITEFMQREANSVLDFKK